MELSMFEFTLSKGFQQMYPGACAGALVMRGVSNTQSPPELHRRTQAIEEGIRARCAGFQRVDLAALPVVQAYAAYYRRFKKTYHVLLQLESVVMKGRTLPRGTALLEAMFGAELDNLLLTAGHDLTALQRPVQVDVSQGHETYTTLSGETKTLKPGDMFMLDTVGVISSVLYGPDERTRLTPAARDVLFTVYAPEGVQTGTVRKHLEDIRDGVLLAAPQAQVELLEVFSA
jgi:DNA/RNA-binding domain of Phe-tRNA-synthetase-like protein